MCWNKGRLCWKIAKLFCFCHLKKMVRPETFGPYYVRRVIVLSKTVYSVNTSALTKAKRKYVTSRQCIVTTRQNHFSFTGSLDIKIREFTIKSSGQNTKKSDFLVLTFHVNKSHLHITRWSIYLPTYPPMQ